MKGGIWMMMNRDFSAASPCVWLLCGLLAACLEPCVSASAGIAAASQGTIQPLATAHFAPDDDVKCLADVLEAGDPAKGPSTLLLKAKPGCLVPWHYHSALEELTVITGRVRTEMTGHEAATLGPGGFAAMPGKMAHQFRCGEEAQCLMLVTFDGIYDIFWVKR